ncbi:hypothetical protein ACFVHQ_10455 [Actinomycetes bacterium NPDC127524]
MAMKIIKPVVLCSALILFGISLFFSLYEGSGFHEDTKTAVNYLNVQQTSINPEPVPHFTLLIRAIKYSPIFPAVSLLSFLLFFYTAIYKELKKRGIFAIILLGTLGTFFLIISYGCFSYFVPVTAGTKLFMLLFFSIGLLNLVFSGYKGANFFMRAEQPRL